MIDALTPRTFPREVSTPPPARYRADFILKVHCGCGHRSHSVEEGLDHAEHTGHTLHITGEIRTK